jgi:hypothetical protein
VFPLYKFIINELAVIFRQEMEDKRYGVPIHLVEQFKQISLKRKAERMSFIGYCETKLGVDAISIWRNIIGQNRIISINPFPYLPDGLNRYLLPQQTLIHLDDRSVRITLEDGQPFIIIFADNHTKEHFVTALGDLNVYNCPFTLRLY